MGGLLKRLGIVALILFWAWQPLSGLLAAAHEGGEQESRLVVAADGPYTSIEEALEAAQDGDTIEVRGGVYHGPLVVDKAVHLLGVDWPVIDGQGMGAVVKLVVADVHFQGFVVRNSGNEPDRDHAGIAVSAPRAIVEGNRLEDVLFGVYIADGPDSVVRGNDITGKAQYDLGRKGDGIRLWYSAGVLVEQNVVHETRDLVIWYSPDVVIRENVVRDGRYGVHLMYCDGAQITGNQFLNNSVGVYTMYSVDVLLSDNLLRGQRGPSGYALGFKDADNITAVNNVLVDNSAGIFLDGTPFSPQGYSRFEQNVVAFNDVGVILQPAARGNHFSGNTFWENAAQTALQGGGQPGVNEWQGNYWSDYSGFDADNDGQGDVPYRAERFFEGLAEREPRLRILAYSPAVQAIEFAAHSFPIIRPQPKLTDPAPLMRPPDIPPFARPVTSSPILLIVISVVLLLLGVLLAAVAFVERSMVEPADNRKDAKFRWLSL
jgi:nitrous oxidase accessory protein